ncbi:hypothetical protein NL676_017281 [Syzygium grande]|nr:hypothetical protein NL676_017281 [Syzygium grande]
MNRAISSNDFEAENDDFLQLYSSLHHILLSLFSLELSWRPSAFVKADATSFVRNLCSQTVELDACKNCVSSETTEYILDVTYSVLFCMYTQAVYGHDHADELSQAAAYVAEKQALEVCRDTLFVVANNLSDALSMLEGSDYKVAFANKKNSQRRLVSCEYVFWRFATGDGNAIPTMLLDDMVLQKRLFDVGHYFFRLIIKINNR